MIRLRSFVPARTLLPFILAAVPAFAVERPEAGVKPNLDVRLPAREEDRGGFMLRTPTAIQRAVATDLAREIPGLTLRWDGMSASPKWLSAPPGLSLSPRMEGTAEFIARTLLRSRAALFGLAAPDMEELPVTSVLPSPGGGSHVHFAQRLAGLQVHGGHANVNLGPHGAVLSVGSGLYAGLVLPGPPVLRAAEAARIAVQDVYPEILFVGQLASAEKEEERRTVFSDPGFARPPEARLVLFPEREGARLAWEVRVAEPTLRTDYRILVDAASGSVLFRQNMTLHATARIVNAIAPDPEGEEISPPQYQIVALPSSTPQSPSGWIAAPGTSLSGNNATSHLLYWTQAGLAEPSASYDYPYDTLSSSLVNAWYWANDAHDRFYAAGFDEAAGNYQTDNFGLGGVGGDPMRVVAWTAGGRDNAFYTTSVDGGTSTVNFFWVGCQNCGDHDGYPENGGERATGFMRDVVVHEYTHGVSTRMVGGPAVDNCLFGTQSGAMGEGWSDLFAASFYDDPKIGGHFFEGVGWMRDPRHDVGYGKLCAVGDFGCEVHSDGMIWLAALWDLRDSMIALDPVNGQTQFQKIVVKGLAATACFPDMLDARDGILTADTALYASAHHGPIWNVFAKRGMGSGASSTGENDTAPVTSTTVPPAYVCTPPAVPTGLTTSPGANVIVLAYTAAGASAVEIWREDLDNPFDVYVRIASTNNLSTYADTTVQGGKTYSYKLVALGAGGVTCRSAMSSSASATATGTCTAYPIFSAGLTIADGASSCALTLSWNAATPGCPGSTVVYNVYRAATPGFEPSETTLIGRTSSTTFTDTPPGDGRARYYMVLAQHGTLSNPPDHRDRGSSQVLRFVPRIPTLGRTTVSPSTWNFDSGAAGWTTDNSPDPAGGWTLGSSAALVATRYAGTLLAPEDPAGGSGSAFVTGLPDGPTVTDHDCDGASRLISPVFDGTGGKTIFSFDYWAAIQGNFYGGLDVQIGNGTTTVTVSPIGLMTTQDFETASANGWQRAELDLAAFVTPTTTMRVTFIPNSGDPFSEFGVDNVRVEQATVCARSDLKISSVTVQDGNPGWGNGNGILEPGETARLVVTLRNQGNVAATTPTGTIVGVSNGLLVHEGSAGFPNIPVSGTGSSTGDGFTVTLPAFACGDTANVRFEFADAQGTKARETWSPETGQLVTDTILADTFETDQGWFPDPTGAGVGKGIWQRGDPVGTLDGANQANPENDSPNDAGAQCYVTENGPVAGDKNANDVDAVISTLLSPLLNFAGYKRTRMNFDLWYYDNSSSSDFWQDYSDWGAFVDDGVVVAGGSVAFRGNPTSGWVAQSTPLTDAVPMVPGVRVAFEALDRDATWYAGAADHVVEMGVDNVRVLGDRQSCSPLGINRPPNGIGNTILLSKSSTANLVWTSSPVDGTHDAAAYYELFVSSSPSGGFSVADTATLTSASRALGGPSEYYRISAVNAAGTSGDEPAP